MKAPPDTELLVLVFEALRPAAATELKLASFTLQGAVGKPVAVEPPGAYRARSPLKAVAKVRPIIMNADASSAAVQR